MSSRPMGLVYYSRFRARLPRIVDDFTDFRAARFYPMIISTCSVRGKEKNPLYSGFLVGHRGLEPRTLCLKGCRASVECVRAIQAVQLLENSGLVLFNRYSMP